MKVMFITLGEINVASTRVRVLEYLPYLKKEKIKFRLFCFPTKSIGSTGRLYVTGKLLLFKKMLTLPHLLKLLHATISLLWCDLLFIQKTISFPSAFLSIAKTLKKKIIYDFDDALFAPWDKKPGNQNSKPKKETEERKKHLFSVIKQADKIITNTAYNARSIEKEHSQTPSILLSHVNTTKLTPKKLSENGRVTIGWIGSRRNLLYFDVIKNALIRLANKYENISIKIVGAKNYSFDGISPVCKEWCLEDELADLHSFDVGIMPLKDDEWTRGKGGFKLLQYMAVGIPSVASPVGINKTLVKENLNGFLASSEDEWVEKLSKLIENESLRRKMGEAGREIAEQNYSIELNAGKLIGILNKVYNGEK